MESRKPMDMDQPAIVSQEQVVFSVKKMWEKLYYVIQRREEFERDITTPQLALLNYLRIHTGICIGKSSTKILANFWESLTEADKIFWYNVSNVKNASVKEKQKLLDEDIVKLSERLKSQTLNLPSGPFGTFHSAVPQVGKGIKFHCNVENCQSTFGTGKSAKEHEKKYHKLFVYKCHLCNVGTLCEATLTYGHQQRIHQPILDRSYAGVDVFPDECDVPTTTFIHCDEDGNDQILDENRAVVADESDPTTSLISHHCNSTPHLKTEIVSRKADWATGGYPKRNGNMSALSVTAEMEISGTQQLNSGTQLWNTTYQETKRNAAFVDISKVSAKADWATGGI